MDAEGNPDTAYGSLNKNHFSLRKRWSLSILYLLGFIGDFNMAMISIIAVLRATVLHATTVQVGWIGTAYGLSYSFMPIIMGRVSDRLKRKTSLKIATLLFILSSFLLIIDLRFTELSLFLVFTIIVLIGLGISYSFYWPSIEAFISEFTEESQEEHERAFSNFCIWWGLGIAFGAWTGGVLSEISLSVIGFIALVLYVLSFLLTFLLPSTPSEKEKHKEDIEIPPQPSQNNGKIHKTFLIAVLLGNLLFALMARLISSYFANYAKLEEGLNYSGFLIGNVTLIFGLARMLYFYIGRYLPKTIKSLIFSSFLSMLALLVLFLTQVFHWILIALLLLGFMNGQTYYVSLVILMNYEKEEKGTKAGMFEAMVGIGSSITPIIAGSLAFVSLQFPFLVFAFFALGIGIAQVISLKQSRRISSNT